MEKYIILIVILFLLLLYLNKNIEGYDEMGEEGGRDRIAPYLDGDSDRSFKTANILSKDLSKKILEKCSVTQQGYIPPKDPPIGPWLGHGCLNNCNDPIKIDGNCGETIYKDESSTEAKPVHYKLCRKTCSSQPFNEAERAIRYPKDGKKGIRNICTYDNECSTCYKDISYNISEPTDPTRTFKCGVKVMCPNSNADDGCGGYNDDVNGGLNDDVNGGLNDDVNGGLNDDVNGDFGSNGLGSTGPWDKTNSSNNPWKPLNPNSSGDNPWAPINPETGKPLGPSGDSVNSEPWEPINETVDCSTYPKHPKCSHTHTPQMFGCVNNAKEGEINSMSKPGTLDSSWGLFK